MNVFFMDYRFVKLDNWKYIVDVLKIKDIFCFFDPKETIINFYLQNFNIRVFYQGLMSIEDFSKKVTYNITNTIKSTLPNINNDTSNPQETYIFCQESKKYSPRHNTMKTSDPNYLVLGKICWHYIGESIFIKKVSEYRDTASDIVQYAFNILRKQLGTDVFRERICTYMIDSVTRDEFILVRDSWKTPKRKFIPFLNSLLRDTYPQIFPSIIKNGKERATTIHDSVLLTEGINEYNQFLKDLEEEEDQALQDMIEEEEDRQREQDERQMIDDFWNELGENTWNID